MDAIASAYAASSSSEEEEEDHDVDRPDASDSSRAHSEASSDTDDDGNEERQSKRRRTENPPVMWTRSFPHVAGNWPSHVKIVVPMDESLRSLVDRLTASAQSSLGSSLELIPMATESDVVSGGALHMSLSRPFVLTYDQIDGFVDELRAALKWRTRFVMTVEEARVLVNDDRTRSFLALAIGAGSREFCQTVRYVDTCMRAYGLSTYYEDPIPHISFASTLGDALQEQLPTDPLTKIIREDSACVRIRVSSVQATIGNKHFQISLQ